jgi:hypothetical protein
MQFRTALLATVASFGVATAAQSAQVAALVGDDAIAIVDTTKKQATKTMKVTGLSGALLGIDVRPADGMLYGVVDDGSIVTIGMDGKATKKSQLDMPPPKMGVTVDFNPAADRLRVMGSDGTSLRINVDDGKVIKDGSHKFADGDKNKGGKPNVVAGAYSNSVKGTKETTLYNIDGMLGALLTQAPPNDGVLNTVGMLGIKADAVAFDIWSDGKGKNDAWLMAGGTLYSVDLKTGKAVEAAKISGVPGAVRDIAILPAM